MARSARVVSAVLALCALASSSVAGSEYDDKCDALIRLADKARKQYQGGNRDRGESTMAKIKKTYEEALALEPEELQAPLNYGTILVNANKLDEAEYVWTQLQAKLTDDVLKENPFLMAYAKGKANLCRYGKVSMEKDTVYAGGKGDVQKAIELVGKQLALRPMPQILYDRATLNVMVSSLAKATVNAAITDFDAQVEQGLVGYAAAKRQLLGVPCGELKELTPFPLAVNPKSGLTSKKDEVFTESFHLGTKKRKLEYHSSDLYVSRVEGVVIRGIDAFVTKDVCSRRWVGKKLVSKLAAFYTEIGEPQRAREAGKILQQFGGQPDILRDALVQRYGKKIEEIDADTTWLEEWAEDAKKDCECTVYKPAQSPRVNLAHNLPMVDVFGEAPVVDQQGRPEVLHPPRQPGANMKEAALVAQFAGASFYHTVIEVMAKVAVLVEDRRFDSVVIITPQDTSKNRFIEPWLRLLLPEGRDFKKTFRQHQGEAQVATLHVPTWRRDDMVTRTTPPRSALLRLRRLLTKGADATERDTIVVLRRRDTAMRRLKEDDALFAEVQRLGEDRGYRVVGVTSALAAAKARDVFLRAAMVVAVHGGAMANTIFCQPKTVVVELGFDTPYAYDYVHLSTHLGFEHHLLPLAESANGMGAPVVSFPDHSRVVELVKALKLRGRRNEANDANAEKGDEL